MAQTKVPDGDVSNSGSWQASSGGNLYADVNSGASEDDSTYISVEDQGSDAECVLSLQNPTVPLASGANVLHVRAKQDDSSGYGMLNNLKIEVIEGGSVRGSSTQAPGTSFSDLTAVSISSVGTWADVQVRLTFLAGNSNTGYVSEVYLLTQDASGGGGGSTPIAAISMNHYRQQRI